ncbi:hypothetical protein GCM10027414_14180 [Humibacter ginsengiterrae]
MSDAVVSDPVPVPVPSLLVVVPLDVPAVPDESGVPEPPLVPAPEPPVVEAPVPVPPVVEVPLPAPAPVVEFPLPVPVPVFWPPVDVVVGVVSTGQEIDACWPAVPATVVQSPVPCDSA